jgi:glutamine amidotransferase
MSNAEITVVDYGMGNLLSVQRGFEYCGAKVILTSDPKKILSAKRVVLPGVGAFSNAMRALEDLGLITAIQELALRNTPLLGICLGMQLLLEESDEFGVTAGLGLVPGRVVALPDRAVSGEKQKIPHIGWNALEICDSVSGWKKTLLEDNRPGEAVYFVHSFMANTTDPTHRIADTLYGGHKVAAVISRENITGCQFHPEKSHQYGEKLLNNFAQL